MSTRHAIALSAFMVGVLAGCAGEQEVKLDKLNLTITLPGGWTHEVSDDEDGPIAELSSDGRQVKIHKSSEKIDSLDQLKRAIEKTDGKVESEEKTPAGFGVVFQDKSGKKLFRYVANLSGTQYACDPGAYYDVDHLEAAVGICKTMKA
ncbi:hypothetical protein ACFOY2_40215 [Nonomuraea purpurea]|uniref:Uncharacterized protein n=1 Tax=Nonomuraea purpurea TaxID=1849276 RepID=A0ABV8GKR4_9ACTN